ncbi:carboxylesterase family protein, partial [Paenibacillus xylanexedens]|uniref:carboxylesterase family protein n=1 Tax=Paenibacillus xylanexedens TaxID=528191 RepID=UPI0011A646AF
GDVMVVRMNYGLGGVGLLHMAPLGEWYVRNGGVLDEGGGVESVKENMWGFGGDGKNVRVLGESGGSMSIGGVMGMGGGKGLFKGGMMQSGG